MNKPRKILLITASFFAVFLGAVFSYSTILKSLRRGIVKELRQEIKAIVRGELDNYVTNAGGLSKGSQALLAPGEDESIKPEISSPKNIGARFRDKIRLLVKDELKSFIGGAPDANSAAVSGGLQKKITSKAKETNADKSRARRNKIRKQQESGEEDSIESVVGGKERIIEKTLIERGGMLLPKGRLQIEPSFSTAHFSANRINIQGFSILPILVIGEISTETVKRDIFIETLSLKYGLLHNLQGELKFPYRYQFERVTDNLGAETTRDAGGFGDMEFSLSRQIAYEKGFIPDTLLSISAKPPTGRSPYNRAIGLGTGHWGIRSALIAAKSSDPIVVFGSLSYTWNIKRDIANYGVVEPGDTIGYSLGTALALSYQTAINFQFEQGITSKMRKNGKYVNGSFLNAASLRYGFTWSLSEKSSVDFSVSHGLTTDAPDYIVELRFPFTF